MAVQDNISTIICNAITINKDPLKEKIKPIINQLEKVFEENKEAILNANKIDQKNRNGFLIDFDHLNRIFSNVKQEPIPYGEVILSQKDDEKQIIYGIQKMDYGTVLVIHDGDPYILLEMTIRNLMAGNATIFSNHGFMYGTNQLFIQIFQSVLKQFQISKYFVQLYITENFDEILGNYANIDLVVCIGDSLLQQKVLEKSKNKTIVCGYGIFELYVEDEKNIEFIKKIKNSTPKIQIYAKKGINIEDLDVIFVEDIEEAIAQINYTGSHYASSIFTSSKENASKFIKKVKSKTVTVNTSPTIEQVLDIQESDLVYEKTILYPFSLSLSGEREEIIIYEK